MAGASGRRSPVISGDLRRSLAISGDLWRSLAISGDLGPKSTKSGLLAVEIFPPAVALQMASGQINGGRHGARARTTARFREHKEAVAFGAAIDTVRKNEAGAAAIASKGRRGRLHQVRHQVRHQFGISSASRSGRTAMCAS